MDIYVEYVLLDNLVIDYLLLYYTNKILGLKCQHSWILLLGAIFGAVCSVLLPLLPVIPFISLLLKFFLSCLLVFFLGKVSSIRDFINKILTFYLLTFALGGISYAVLALMNAKFTNGLLTYDASLPLGVILLVVFVYIRIIEYIARVIYKKRNLIPFIRDISLIIDNRQINMKGLLDSGNGLIERRTGLPVVIISLTTLMRVYKLKDIQTAIESGKSDKIKNVRFINYSTVAGTSKKMLIFDADELILKDENKEISIKNFALGLCMHDFKSKDDFEILLNPAIF